MEHFYTFKIKHFKRWSIVVILALFTATFLWFEQSSSFSVFSSKDDPSALTKGNADEPNIGLTFNISWGEEKVHDILEQLEKNDVQATFFVSGEWAERHPDILEKITEGKHELGMLGYRYKSYVDQDIEQVRQDIVYAKKVFQKLGYEEIETLRAPSGHLNEEVVELVENQGLHVIQWNVNPNDWKNPGTQKITNHVMEETGNGDIILLHASDSAKQTADSL